ncbi:peptidoglycan-binding domain-containing protein [Roseococcus sp.]|uniref:peptidoglycan-binding domain-containing protein n=1 Tax=Roseococcus sp. TaxID=2109646 RepID=UPI003BA87E48
MNLPLRLGSRGPDVARVQSILGETADGIFGEITLAGVRTWQRARGLQPDGVVGPATWERMQGASTPSSSQTNGGVVPNFSAALIAKGFPRCVDPAAWATAFTAAVGRFPAFNRTGWACILAKANTEAGGLTRWDENLFYTTVEQVTRMHGSRAGLHPEKFLRNPRALGDQVYAKWGGYDGRGLGVIQLTGLPNHTAFASDMGMSLGEARGYMQTIPGAAMTAPWYLQHYKAVDAANRGDMRAVLAVVAGKTVAGMDGIWASIHGDQQMADFERFKALLVGVRGKLICV